MRLDFYRQAAQKILSCHAPDMSDLRRTVVVLPNYHVALPLAQALSAVSGLPALLLPQMLTLPDWAQALTLDLPVQSDTLRIVALYQALRERNWFSDADLWSLSRELLSLMDELTCHCVTMPETTEEFSRQLTAAYQARTGVAMQFEARVVHELWYAMAALGELDAPRAYQQRLARLAMQIKSPFYVLQTGDLEVTEDRFLQTCREQGNVTVFDLRSMISERPDLALLTSALQLDITSDNLLSTAAGFHTKAHMGQRLKLFGAHGLEQEAEAADTQIRRWLLDGKQSIAVVVHDRLVARRLRALLERAQIEVQDETGWTFSTLSVSTALIRWLEALQSDFYYLDVLDLLKSPFLFADDPAQRKQSAFQFEQMVRKHGVIAHLQDFISLAEREFPDLIQTLLRFQQAAHSMPKRPASISDWLSALHEGLDILGIGWRQDAAGQQLIRLLSQWQEELKKDVTACSFAEWRRWLSQQLDLNTFRDVSVDSPVLFTHLAATRWRRFDAVVMIGCDAMHLPAPAHAGQWFNDAVRLTLGLPLSTAQQRQVRDDLLALLGLNDTVLATWQQSQNGEPNLLSPYLEMLRALHLMAFGDDLADRELGELLVQVSLRTPSCYPLVSVSMPGPAVLSELIPTRISPSGYNSLMDCPYQYFARHILRLNELDEVREALDKRDYGIWVHAVLQRFHSEIPLLSHQDKNSAELCMRRISDEVFGIALAHDYLAQAWLLRWQSLIPAYLDWQLENEHMGWHYQGSEVPFNIQVTDHLQLYGRLDRVDVQRDKPEQILIIDYKTQSAQRLKSRLKEAGEDVQLACYVAAMDAGAAEFVSLDDETVLAVSPLHDIAELAVLNLERLQTIFAQLQVGMGMPAHGIVCDYCEMKGLCRRGTWVNGIEEAG